MKRAFLVFVLVILAFTAVVSCASTGSSASSDTPASSSPAKCDPLDYVRYVISQIKDGSGKMAVLDNRDFTIIYRPGLSFELTKKATGETIIGRAGFSISIGGGESFVYMKVLESLDEMSNDKFMDSDFYKNPDFKLVPTEASKSWISYSIAKAPIEMGKNIRFSLKIVPLDPIE